ncbi:MAG: hypothetical protein ACE362_19895 [Phaeodactylibacter xiamenensis]|uniref:Uncharacterized protein n=1 Tax=Phaeodactylibacter xiamenensis TaxID=1524460 RepID=A0A098S1D6_9BACT|nr:hypothetical protein [Phaeodactylibacter xiamenensis]KGE85925.1 hypothetical protein IX84_25305 [Phaeodactylibacter xiamenensis]MCR9051275.1 hypothetical protein [bacterium]
MADLLLGYRPAKYTKGQIGTERQKNGKLCYHRIKNTQRAKAFVRKYRVLYAAVYDRSLPFGSNMIDEYRPETGWRSGMN